MASGWPAPAADGLLSLAFYYRPSKLPISLGIRRYLVVLKFELETLRFSIKSDEAQTEAQALGIALARLPADRKFKRNDTAPQIDLRKLVAQPTVVADTEEARIASGIDADCEYPSEKDSYSGKSLWEILSEDRDTVRCHVIGCGTTLTTLQRFTGGQCSLHRPKNSKHDTNSISYEELAVQAAIVLELGRAAAAKKLGLKPDTLKKRMQVAKTYGIPTKPRAALTGAPIGGIQ